MSAINNSANDTFVDDAKSAVTDIFDLKGAIADVREAMEDEVNFRKTALAALDKFDLYFKYTLLLVKSSFYDLMKIKCI